MEFSIDKNLIKEFKLDKKEFLSILSDYLDDALDRKMTPKGKSNYVGLELECFSRMDVAELSTLIIKHKLLKYISIGDDSSVCSKAGTFPYEIRLLIPETKINTILTNFQNFLTEGKFGTNSSCGLHVHLDMRHRNYKKCFDKLYAAKFLLRKLVKKSRLNSEYCESVNKDEYWRHEKFDHWYGRTVERDPSRHLDINAFHAYNKYKTIEIRLHEGTVNCNKIKNWITLLLKVINAKKELKVSTKPDEIKKELKLSKTVTSYINEVGYACQ